MPKIRVAHGAEEAAKVSLDQPVEINLKPETAAKEIIYGKPQPTEPEKESSSSPEVVKSVPEESDEPSLERQLQQLKDTEGRARQRAMQAEADRATMFQQAQQRDREIVNLRRQAAGSHHETLVSSIAAVQADAESAQSTYANALAAGDHVAAAEAHRKIARSEARLVQLEAGKDELERRLNQQPSPQQPQHQIPLPSPNPVEQMLQQMPALNDGERDYLRRHPEALTNPANQRRLEVAFLDAQNEGIERGSEEYFEFFDKRLGYKSQNKERSMPDEGGNDDRRVSAPVSRSVPSASRESDTRVVLSPQQREAARWAGVNDVEYAKQLLKLRQLKRDGYYDERR